jgi:hypothetical protein
MNYYLYRHIRLDKNEPFYIGIGHTDNNKYNRAYTKNKRNDFWKNIVNHTDYEVEIVYETNLKDEIFEKEKEFINLYGRRDLNNGTLVNLTDGGEFSINKSRYSVEKQLETAKKNGSYYINVERMRKMSFKKGERNQIKKTFLYTDNGVFLNSFDSMKECGEYTKCHPSNMNKYIAKKESHIGYIYSNLYLGQILNLDYFKIKKDKNKAVEKIDNNGNVINTYVSMTDAANKNNTKKENISRAIKLNIKSAGFNWRLIKK